MRVWNGGTSPQAQTARPDGFGVTSSIRRAQEIFTGRRCHSRLFFGGTGRQLVVSAFTDNAGVSGTLINEAAYTADRAGFQDVPLRVPGSSFSKIRLVVRGQSAAIADLGTPAPSTDPYAGRLLPSSNAGATWSTVNRDLYLVLYNRQPRRKPGPWSPRFDLAQELHECREAGGVRDISTHLVGQ